MESNRLVEQLETEAPNYVLETNEGILVPKNEKHLFRVIRKPVWIIIAIILLGSFILPNYMIELSWSGRIILVVFAIVVSFGGGWKSVPSPIEVRFYDDYFVVYRKKRFYNAKVTRKEFNKFFYHDVEIIEYRTETKRIQIEGKIEAVWYNYNKDDTVPEKPTYHRIVKKGMCFFYPEEKQEEIVSIIEAHSPLTVIWKES